MSRRLLSVRCQINVLSLNKHTHMKTWSAHCSLLFINNGNYTFARVGRLKFAYSINSICDVKWSTFGVWRAIYSFIQIGNAVRHQNSDYHDDGDDDNVVVCVCVCGQKRKNKKKVTNTSISIQYWICGERRRSSASRVCPFVVFILCVVLSLKMQCLSELSHRNKIKFKIMQKSRPNANRNGYCKADTHTFTIVCGERMYTWASRVPSQAKRKWFRNDDNSIRMDIVYTVRVYTVCILPQKSTCMTDWLAEPVRDVLFVFVYSNRFGRRAFSIRRNRHTNTNTYSDTQTFN